LRYAERVAIEVQPLAVDRLVELVNGWGTVPRTAAADRPPPACAEPSASPARLGEHGG
jgi:hypothetical protein